MTNTSNQKFALRYNDVMDSQSSVNNESLDMAGMTVWFETHKIRLLINILYTIKLLMGKISGN